MARKLFDNGILSVLTQAGAIGVGWKLHFYTGGTSNPITTYNARTAGSANANPLESLADGRFPKAWIDEGQTIKWMLADANDLPKITVDDVLLASSSTPIDASLTNFLAASSPLPIANGGTNATSAANALTNLGAFPAAGGTVSGNIARSGKGCHPYFNDAAMTTPKIYITASGSADPRAGVPGEIWLKY